ncbi:DUF2339 domain-containing protein [Nocardia sp. GCM10030253]|uniref:DUF2339 domain-containing protein n=1 Tax=Nocardia sp. GCM10030253 TaxID=3273404 RepID=UPI0036328AF1
MTTSIDPALLSRLSGEFAALGTQMGVLGRDLELLRTQVTAGSVAVEGLPGQSAGIDAAAVDESARVPAPGPVQSPIPGSPQRLPMPPGGVGGSQAGPVPGGGAPPYVPGYTPAPVAGQPNWPGAPTERPAASVPNWPGAPVGMPAASMPGWSGAPAGMPGAYPPGWSSPPAGMPAPGAHLPGVPRGPMPAMGAAVPVGTRPPVRRGPAVPHTPWWQQEGMISRILAVAGVGVTLIGVVMLLVLAAQAGFFGPVPRVIAGAVFSAVLVGAGMRVFGRAGGRVGAIALAATGIAGAYLDVVAVTSIYEWLYPALGLAVALAVAAGGVALAMQWKSQPLAVLVVAGAAALSPVVTTELVLVAFLIVLQLSCVPVQLVRDWPLLHVVRTLPAVLATLLAIGVAAFDTGADDRVYRLLIAAVAVAVVGLVGGILVVRRRPGDLTATLAFGLATLPLLAAPVLFERHAGAVIAAVFAVVLLFVAALPMTSKLRELVKIPGHFAIVAAVAGSFALLEVCVGVTEVQTLPIALFLVTLGFLGVAGQQRSRVAAGIAAAFAAVGALVFLDTVNPETLATQRFAEEWLGISTALAAALALAVVAVAVWCARKFPSGTDGGTTESVLWIPASVVALYAVTAATVSIGIAIGIPDGFVVGHSAATILWMAAATGALLFGLRNLSRSAAVAKLALGSGLLVTAAALAKLFLFDLATLDGLVRVAAFLVVGVLLLVVGTRYARAFAEASGANRDSGDAATH